MDDEGPPVDDVLLAGVGDRSGHRREKAAQRLVLAVGQLEVERAREVLWRQHRVDEEAAVGLLLERLGLLLELVADVADDLAEDEALRQGRSISRLVATKIAGDIQSRLTVLAPEGCRQLPKECFNGSLSALNDLPKLPEGRRQNLRRALHLEILRLARGESNAVCVVDDVLASPTDPFLREYPWRICRGQEVFHIVPLSEVPEEMTSDALGRLSQYPPGLGFLSKVPRRWGRHPELTGADEEEIAAGLLLGFMPIFDDETVLLYRP